MTDKLYICPKAKECNFYDCLHKDEHRELNNCTKEKCRRYKGAMCIPLPEKPVCEDEPNYEDMALAEQKDKETQRKDWEREQYVEAMNTDKQLWKGEIEGREVSFHTTEQGGLGIHIGGYVVVRPIENWKDLIESQFCDKPLPDKPVCEVKPSPVNDLEGILNRYFKETVQMVAITTNFVISKEQEKEYEERYKKVEQTAITEILDYFEGLIPHYQVCDYDPTIEVVGLSDRNRGWNDCRTELLSKIKLLRGEK